MSGALCPFHSSSGRAARVAALTMGLLCGLQVGLVGPAGVRVRESIFSMLAPAELRYELPQLPQSHARYTSPVKSQLFSPADWRNRPAGLSLEGDRSLFGFK